LAARNIASISRFRISDRDPEARPRPHQLPAFLSDAIIVASLQALAQKISDTNVREAVERGHSTAIEALQKHIGPEVTIQTE
jgi:hypothetical protein